jgi:uncharacterized membrane protein
MRSALAILFGPLLAVLLQSYVGFEHFELTTKARMMTGLAVLDFLFFFVMGNYASTLRFGSPGGFRTPWTLKDKHVWKKTHRYLGRGLFAISALAMLLLLFVPPKTAIFAHLGVLIAFKMTAFAYSYSLWRSLQQRHLMG